MVERNTALLVSAAEEDHQALSDVFSHQGWILYHTATLEAAVALVSRHLVPVLITDRDLPDGNWRHLFTAIQQLPAAPLFIVASRLADEHLWAEVLNLGGHDILCKPFQTKEVLWVLRTAWQCAERDEPAMHGKSTGCRCPENAE
jgi:DNA-binding response OmpR family regulator